MDKHDHRLSIRNISVSRRLLYSYILMSLLPLTVLALIAYQVSDRAIRNKTNDYTQRLLHSLATNIDSEAEKYRKFSDEIMVSDVTQKGLLFFNTWSNMKKNRYIKEEINSEISVRLARVPYVRQTLLIDGQGALVYSQGFLFFSMETAQKCIQYYNSGINWISVNEGSGNYLVYTHPIPSLSGQRIIGHLLVLIDPSAFYHCLSEMNLGDDAGIFIADSQGLGVTGQNVPFSNGDAVDETLVSLCRQPREQPIINNYELNQIDSIIYYQPLDKMDWLLVTSIPYEYLRSETSTIRTTILILISVCLLCSFFVYQKIWKSITTPIGKLVVLLGKSASLNFEKDFVDDSRDELGYLGRTYVQIIKKMQELLAQVEVEQRQKREYELKMLQAQINPHFLFNTLNSLRWTALMSRAPNVAEGLAALSDLLKNTIIDKNEFVTIGEELKNLENYITIQRIRYGSIFTVDYCVPPEIKHCYTLKFLFQPIVENAILHGIDENRSNNQIQIKVEEQSDRLLLTVSDNGKGFDISKHRDPDNDKRLSGIGLSNVQQRIQLFFGNHYHFSIESQVGKGTTVYVEAPKMDLPPDTSSAHIDDTQITDGEAGGQ